MGSTNGTTGAVRRTEKARPEARPGKAMATKPARPRRPLEVVDFLPLPAEFSVVPVREGVYEYVFGKVPGAVATFAVEEADCEAGDLEHRAYLALRRQCDCPKDVEVFGDLDVKVGAKRLMDYVGGQALHVTGRVGAVLKLAEVWGRPWPSAPCVATMLGYPVWLVELVIQAYRRQVGG